MKVQKMFILARGFALIATVLVLLLMTVIAVAFMSISAVTVRTSRIDWAQEEARANARLGLMVAIGELQRDLGPDQRIAITGAIMDSQPDTSTIEGVQNPHWTGFVSSIFEGNQNGSPFTRDMDQGGLEDARNGTNYRIRPLIRNYFVSGNEGGPERMAGGRRFLDAVTEPLALSEDTVEIVSLGSTIRPEDRVRVVKTNLSRPRFPRKVGHSCASPEHTHTGSHPTIKRPICHLTFTGAWASITTTVTGCSGCCIPRIMILLS